MGGLREKMRGSTQLCIINNQAITTVQQLA